MARERLSQLQKWIIEECFRTTVLLDRSNLKLLRGTACYNNSDKEYYKNCSELITKKRSVNNGILYYCNKRKMNCNFFKFYREDILLSYFNLTTDHNTWAFEKVEHFIGSPNNNKAYVSLTRTLQNLYEKGYLTTWYVPGITAMSKWIELTEKGKQKALELLELDDKVIKEPPLLNEKKQEEMNKKLDDEIKRINNILRMG